MVASSVLWLWLLNGDYGLVNTILRPGILLVNRLFGLSLGTPSWLTAPLYIKPALVLMSTWGVGGSVIIYLAALGDVPRQLYEAAEIDGAGAWRKTWNVTLPMISPVLFFTLIIGLIGTFQYSSQPLVVFGGGGRDNSALFYSLCLFQNAFLYLRMGYASAQAWILFLVIVVATLVVFRTTPAIRALRRRRLMNGPAPLRRILGHGTLILFFFTQRTFIQGIKTTGMKT